MQFFPEDAPVKLGFTALLEKLAELTLSPEGREAAESLLPMQDVAALQLALRQTAEFKSLLESGEGAPLSVIPSVTYILNKVAVVGVYITEDEAFRLLRWLYTVRKLKSFFEARTERYPALAELLKLSHFDTGLVEELEKLMGADGKLLNSASRELQRLRRTLIQRQAEVRVLLERLLRQARDSGWADARELSLRDERLVIPVLADFKTKIPGLIHDVSGTGQTVYMEPLEALTLNNEVRELRLREQAEVIRILTEVADRVRERLPGYRQFTAFLTAIDLLQAKARLATRLRAELPALENKGPLQLELIEARHPLLLLAKDFASVSPISFRLWPEKRILLISGPNAGGKSVALKTAGLLQVMLQCGMLVPASADSRFSLFTRLFVDIGDDQSLQNDLSTYSSHLMHMRVMLENLNSHSLFLIDEFGTGTDPTLGGPIAEALLAEFVQLGGYGVITTHYSNLKDFATRTPTVENAAMLFDLATLRPSYRLATGMPGASYAFEMAARAGIPAAVLENARMGAGEDRAATDGLLTTLRSRQQELTELREVAEAQAKATAEGLARQKAAEKDLQLKRRQILAEAQHTAARMVREANARIEETIRGIREAQAEKEQTRTLRRALETATTPLPAGFEEEEELPLEPDLEGDEADEPRQSEPVSVGDRVRLNATSATGTVLEKRKDSYLVEIGELHSWVKASEVVKLGSGNQKPATAIPRSRRLNPGHTATVQRELDVRGLRVETTLPLVERFLDDAVLAGLPEVTILHGKGSGALRSGIRAHIEQLYPQVSKMEDGPSPGPGSGITVCTLR